MEQELAIAKFKKSLVLKSFMKSNNKERQDVEFVLNKLKCWSLLKIALIKYAKSVYQLI